MVKTWTHDDLFIIIMTYFFRTICAKALREYIFHARLLSNILPNTKPMQSICSFVYVDSQFISLSIHRQAVFTNSILDNKVFRNSLSCYWSSMLLESYKINSSWGGAILPFPNALITGNGERSFLICSFLSIIVLQRKTVIFLSPLSSWKKSFLSDVDSDSRVGCRILMRL